MIWRVRAALHFGLCLIGVHEWQPCGVPLAHNPWDPCEGSVCAWCLAHSRARSEEPT